MKVLKFGGSSVGDPEKISSVIDIISSSQKDNKNITIVLSAFQGVTDQLIAMSRTAALGDRNYTEILKKINQRHIDAVKKLIKGRKQNALLKNVKIELDELEKVLYGISLVKELTPRTLDFISSFGERLSCLIITEALKAKNIKCRMLDARDIIKTNESFGSAKIKYEVTEKLIKNHFKKNKTIQVVTGFIASTINNETTTLGRGGSDYTASIIGAALQAKEIEIWTDVNGVMTADPRKVEKSFSIQSMTYEEAMEMSHFGAKVIHPPTMQPALNRKIPIRIRNTFNTSFKGTLIRDKSISKRFPIKGISSIDDISLLRIQGSGMVGVAGISSRIFAALARGDINVILISQASSEHSICIAILPKDALIAKRLIEEELHYEMRDELVNEIATENSYSIIAVVGENMRKTPGIAGKVFQSLGKNGINIAAIAQGSSELNISLVINKEDEAKALNALHDSFFFTASKSLNLFVVGTGLIGKTLFGLISKQKNILLQKQMIDINVIGIANSKSMFFDEKGCDINKFEENLSSSNEKMSIDLFIEKMKSFNLPNSIFVDNTSNTEIVKKYKNIFEANISIVTPNKKANSGKQKDYHLIKETAQNHNVMFLYETNVGAGLPIIGTIKDLINSGDVILKIEGILSGTLSYIFNNFDGDKKFSEIVMEANDKGYTEPDPREDLNGLDVARKLLILIREAGYKMEMNDIEVENLLPASVKKAVSVKDFFIKLSRFDDHFHQLKENAEKRGNVLRYIAKYEKGKGNISLCEIDKLHPFYNLFGSDNIVAFHTLHYKERPLVVKGPGAGADVTASGVFADIIRIANYLS